MKVLHWIPAYRQSVHIALVGQTVGESHECTQKGIEYRHWWCDVSDIARARRMAIQQAVEHGHDYLCMQDADIYVPNGRTAICRMLETAEANSAQAVAAICGLRRIHADRVEPNVLPFEPGVYEAQRAGTGLMLIDVNWVREREAAYSGPWFARTYKDDRQLDAEYGEDIFFCELIRGMSGSLWVDGRIETIHAYTDTTHLHYEPSVHGVAETISVASAASLANTANGGPLSAATGSLSVNEA